MKKILFVDDEMQYLLPVIDTLKGLDYKVIEVCDGTDAINKIKDHNPDLVVLDIMMPLGDRFKGKDRYKAGVYVYEEIRNKLELKIPVLFLSVVREDEIIEEIRKIGGIYARICKPTLPSFIIEKIRKMLGD